MRAKISMTKFAALLFAIFVAVVVYAADSKFPVFGFVNSIPGADFTGHIFLMGFLALLVNLAAGCRSFHLNGIRIYHGAAAVLLVVLAEEISQAWIRHRTFSWSDAIGDLLGIWFFGWIVAPRISPPGLPEAVRRGENRDRS